MYTGTKVITTGIVYNTDLVKDATKGICRSDWGSI